MDILFSCRNCIQNCAQTIHVGKGNGFCLRHNSVIRNPDRTTCKYLHRKDLARFMVEEGVREHAAEFAEFSGIVDLITREKINTTKYSEEFVWERASFDPIKHSLAQYHKAPKSWIVIQSFSTGIDGRKSIAYSSLIRRYIDTCDTWASSYRLLMGFLEDVGTTPIFEERDLLFESKEQIDEVRTEALWDTVFCRLSTIQEYGWHAGLEDLMWVTDELNGALVELNWTELQGKLRETAVVLRDSIIEHAKAEDEYFAHGEDSDVINMN